MTELERKALLGDREAQRICTEQGIVLRCPFCGGQATVKTQKQDYGISGTIVKCRWCLASVYCLDERAHITENGIRNVPVENHRYIAIHRWNTRPAPPVGRCGECKHYKPASTNEFGLPAECKHHISGLFIVQSENDFCGYFEPKGDGKNIDHETLPLVRDLKDRECSGLIEE